MSFSANMQHLRATRSMTQEQLAMLLGVSRQAVSKWESDAAYPEMDKLLRLCDIFECSLDDLARGDLTQRPDEPALAVAAGPATDICDYDRHMRARAATIATGVSCALLGIAGFCGTGGIAVYGIETQYIMWPYVFLLAGVLPACALLLFARNAHRSFTRRHPFVEDFYDDRDKTSARTRKKAAWAAAIAIAIAGMAICWFQTFPLQHLYGGLASLNIALACACWLVIHASLNESRTDIAAYNRRLEEKDAWEDSEAQRLSLIAHRHDAIAGACRDALPSASEPQSRAVPDENEPVEILQAAPAPSSHDMAHAAADASACTTDAKMRYRRIHEQRKAAAGIIMALSAIVALVMLFALRSPNWMLALVIGALACIIAWIALPFAAGSQR